jgi:type IX secretion system PorP/SprF family membrane protein
MKSAYILIILTFFSAVLYAQQLTASSFYEMYAVLHNPATAGTSKNNFVGTSFRTQWSGVPGAPRTALLYGSANLQNDKIGLGGYLYNDVTGPTKRTGLQLAYAYHIKINNDALFSVGLEGRMQQFSIDKQKLENSIGPDPVIAGKNNSVKGDAGFGIAYTSKKFQIGTSVSQLMQTKMELYEGTGNEKEQSKLYRHYYLHGNYNLHIDEVIRMVPNLLVVYLPNSPTEIQYGVTVEHNDLLWYGLSWRAKQAWMISAGVKLNHTINFGYSFDIYTTPLSLYHKGSNGHELMLRYIFLK